MLSRLRAGSVVLTCALLAAVQFQPAAAPAAVPADNAAASHTSPATAPASLGSASAMPGQSGQQLAVPVAPGLQPARITGSIAVAGQPTADTVRVSAQGRTLLEGPARGTIALDAPSVLRTSPTTSWSWPSNTPPPSVTCAPPPSPPPRATASASPPRGPKPPPPP